MLPLIHCTSYSLTYSVPLFLKRQCDRTLQVNHSKERVELDLRTPGGMASLEVISGCQPSEGASKVRTQIPIIHRLDLFSASPVTGATIGYHSRPCSALRTSSPRTTGRVVRA